MMQEASLMVPGGNAGSTAQQTDLPRGTPTTLMPVVDQTSPPRKLLRQNDGGNGQDLSAIQAGGNPNAQPLEDMAEVTVERVTRHSSRYQPQATTLKAEVGELQNALLQNRYIAAEEIHQARAHFESCARNYEVEARDVCDVEVVQAVAPIVSQLHNAEGHIVTMKSQLQEAYDRKGSSDISTRQVEDSA